MPSFLSKMSQAELFIAAGALVIVLVDLVFVIFGPYGFSTVAWAAAAVSLVLVLTHGRVSFMSWASTNYTTMLSLAVLVVVVVAIRDVVDDFAFISGRNLDATYFLGLIGYYIGVALMAFGGWQLWSRRTG